MRKVLLVILVWFIFISIVGLVFGEDEISYENTEVYIVEEGDTLWSIASEINDGSYNTNNIVYEIRKLNDGEVVINEGQEVIIPVLY